MTTTTNAIQKSQPRTIAVQSQGAAAQTSPWTYRPSVDIVETGEAYLLFADLPGSTRESIDLNVQDGLLTIDAQVPTRAPRQAQWRVQEYGVGNYHRRFRLDQSIESSRVSAEYRDGVLVVHLPKTERAVARRVEVSQG